MKRKVCFLVADHSFLDARIFKKEAKSLLRQGYDVTMIVPKMNGYLFDINGRNFTDRFQSASFSYEGIEIITYERNEFQQDMKQFLSNIRSGKHEGFIDPLTKLGLLQEADIYHAHEVSSFYSGIGIKRTLKDVNQKNVKLIFDSHELEPDPYSKAENNEKEDNMLMLRLMMKEADYIITVSESIKSWFLNINRNIPVEVIYNSPPLALNYEEKNYNKNYLVLTHEGFIERSRGNWRKIIKITKICSKYMDFRFKIIGGIREEGKNQYPVPKSLENNIKLAGWIAYEDIPKELQEADLGWIDLDIRHSLNNQYAMPNKFFSYLNNGVPILVNRCKDMEEFVQKYNCGLVIENSHASAKDYANAVRYLYDNKLKLKEMSLNARKVMEDLYCWERMEKKLFEIYEKLNNSSLNIID
ncbi:glycosyltransferase [Metabacillus fastidiosus]|uniref:glycosyltransferase n=1 Tax=Metabacillus fastidiosus TaxID=1458 RepID=UPI002DBBA4A3|nr:glycosyltransferase [Metabacillus fastidiosus]MEC2077075.1 glycosyltransferase [Metabacillus fastidiosus]